MRRRRRRRLVPDRWHRNPPWSIGGGLVQLGRHRKNKTMTTTENKNGVFSIVIGNGRSGRPPMGLLALSMPPRNVRGVYATEVSSTQLLGGSSEDDMILGHQVSARLARRVGWPIFVSCSLCGWRGNRGAEGGGGGWEGGSWRCRQCCRWRPPDTTRSCNVARRH
jgi:hypothetical protein